MAIRLECPHCRQPFSVEEDCAVGAPVHCPYCTGLLSVWPRLPERPPPLIERGSSPPAAAVQPKWLPFPVSAAPPPLTERGSSPPAAAQPKWLPFPLGTSPPLRWASLLLAGLAVLALGSVAALFAGLGARPRPDASADLALAESLQSALKPNHPPAGSSRSEEAAAPTGSAAPATHSGDDWDFLPLPDQDAILRELQEKLKARSGNLAETAPRPADAPPPTPRPVKRRHLLSDEDLRKQLALVPEIGLKTDAGSLQHLRRAAATPALAGLPHPTLGLLLQRIDLQGLPLRLGPECQLGKEAAENLHVLSRKLRAHLAAVAGQAPERDDPRLDGEALARRLMPQPDTPDRLLWQQTEAIPALLQMLQGENKSCRLVLVELLGDNPTADASIALAQRALFDLSAEVRELAIAKLGQRPAAQYRAVLLEGLRYPWRPVADHAAEALIALQDREAVPRLVELLADPEFSQPARDAHGLPVVRELVRVNHLENCLLCHAPSYAAGDLVRGRVPDPGRPLPPSSQYYADRDGLFVRADVTYLKQDFSVPQPVDRAGPWPAMQRYDYLVRRRPAWFEAGPGLAGRREIIVSVLDELDGDWKRRLPQGAPGR